MADLEKLLSTDSKVEALQKINAIIENGTGGGVHKMFDPVLQDHILTYEESKGLALQGTYVYKEAIAGSRYGYPTFYEKCVEEKEAATATETTLGDNTITMYVNANGHQFYDIADKEAVDAWYDVYGRAWFYGVDTENERIFLPRNNSYFRIGDESTVGTNQEAGLPNITGVVGLIARNNASGAFYGQSGVTGYTGEGGESDCKVSFNASRSSAIYGNSDTVELDSVNMLLYICVGNTESEEALTNVTEITTSENDTLPWGYHFYSGELLSPTLGYIQSQGQWNNGSSKLYSGFFAEAVNKIGEPFAGGYIKNHTETYDDYDLVINQDDMTFRLPLLDGSEDLPSDKYTNLTLGASGTTYTAPANGWFNLDKVITSGGQGITIANTTSNQAVQSSAHASGNSVVCEMFAKKGDVINVSYDAGGTTHFFRFIYAQGNGSLYFKVANAVQNLELLNAGEVLEAVNNVVPNNRTVWDGQWVYPPKSSTYTSWNTAGTKTIDLSGILPNDGYNYECLFNASYYTNGVSVALWIGTDLCPLDTSTPNWVYEQGSGKGNSGTIILAVGSGRQVQVNASAAPSGGTFHFCVMGYRRLGTNT